MRPLALLAVVTASPLLAAPVPKGTTKAAAPDGTWEVTERYLSGDRDDSRSPIRWTIDEESLAIAMRTRTGFQHVAGSTYRLTKPAGGRANEIDFILKPADDEIPPSTFHGIFELDGDTLKVCLLSSPGKGRPTECKPSKGTDLYVFKRVKDETKGK